MVSNVEEEEGSTSVYRYATDMKQSCGFFEEDNEAVMGKKLSYVMRGVFFFLKISYMPQFSKNRNT